jgi:type VI secretion system protein ImpC
MSQPDGPLQQPPREQAPHDPQPEEGETVAEWDPEQLRDLVRQLFRLPVRPRPTAAGGGERALRSWVNCIDDLLSAQLRDIYRHPDFRRLEATWRGLHYLVMHSETGPGLRLRVLDCTKKDLIEDQRRAAEFDQSALFRKVCDEPYRAPCGTPYGLLVGDYAFGRSAEDVGLLPWVVQVAAHAHAPFVAAAAPQMFGMEWFTELIGPRNLSPIFTRPEYDSWRAFRDSEEARYVALTLPRVLARLPYGEQFAQVAAFRFEEKQGGADPDGYLWMSAAWAYAARITDAFAKYGWMARLRGVEGGGKVEGLPVHAFPTDDGDMAMKCPTEIAINDRREFELSNLGFLPLLHSKNRAFAVFMGAQSCQKPKQYFDPAANANAELSAKFNYLLCALRFVHPLKLMARAALGAFAGVADCERRLRDWIREYVTSDPEDEDEPRRPLADARIEVRETKGKPGYYQVVAWLGPHFQLEPWASMRLVADVPGGHASPLPPLDPAWLAWGGGAVRHLARAIQDERRLSDLPVLADALEEAGCADPDVLSHCREGHDQAPSCWVVDALLDLLEPDAPPAG